MIRRPPRSTRTDTLFPYTTLFRPARLIRHLHTALIIALVGLLAGAVGPGARSEEHTSELQSLRRISSAVFCLKKKYGESSICVCQDTEIDVDGALSIGLPTVSSLSRHSELRTRLPAALRSFFF